MIPGENINDLIGCNATFLSGVVEGFYGTPWTSDQRKILFRRMEKMGLNTYLYAPKDDCKHRMYWREQYSVEEADHITSLVKAADEHNVTFVYALSPGLDITFSSTKDVALLKKKLEQVASFGCKSFALLFDDIEVEMNVADKEVFQSFACAQVSVTNEVYQHLSQPSFLFCPTEYCASRAVPNVAASEYLNTVGSKLLPAINVLWTGPKVISKIISVESIQELTLVLKRPPVIWDNIHANDYDRKRVFLGPFAGRPTALLPQLRGVLTNPNCEFEGNYMAMHTLAQWCKANPACSSSPSSSPIQRAEMQLETEGESPSDSDPGYCPRHALSVALTDWYEEMCIDARVSPKKLVLPSGQPLVTACPLNPTVQCPSSPSSLPIVPGLTNLNELNNLEVNSSYQQPAMSAVPLNSFVDSDVDSDDSLSEAGESTIVGEPMDCAFTPPSSAESSLSNSPVTKGLAGQIPSLALKLQELEEPACPITLQEIALLVDCFYTPFEHGGRMLSMLNDFIWLRNNAHILCDSLSEQASAEHKKNAEDWHSRCRMMRGKIQEYWTLVQNLRRIPNQAILADLISYVYDLQNTLAVVDSFLQWLALGQLPYVSVCALNGNPHTWANPYYCEAFSNGVQEPWVFQGGVQAEFQRLLPVRCCADLFIHKAGRPLPSQLFNVRPYRNSDESAVYRVCKESCKDVCFTNNQSTEYSDLVPDRLVGALLTLSPQYCFVIEDGSGEVCGYVLSALDAKAFHTQCQMAWTSDMQAKYPRPDAISCVSTPTKELLESFYVDVCPPSDVMTSSSPSLVQVGMLPYSSLLDHQALQRAVVSAFNALHANGSNGCHIDLPLVATQARAVYQELGFAAVPTSLVHPSTTTLARPI